jgi:hypothetical protein
MVTAVAAWSIWGTDVFPAQEDPTGSELLSEFKYSLYKKRRCVIECILMTKDPENWTVDELRRWLRAVRFPSFRLIIRGTVGAGVGTVKWEEHRLTKGLS